MADNGNVGIISLDLVIKQKIGEQLENIKRTVEAPAAKVGAAIENAISKPMEKAGKSIGKAVSNAVKSVDSAVSDDISDAIDRALQRMEEQEKSLLDAANAVPRAVSTGNYITYDSSAITAEVEAMSEKLTQKVADTVDKANEKLSEVGKFKVDTEPIGEVRQEVELTTEQVDLLQKKWQQLLDSASAAVSKAGSAARKVLGTVGGIASSVFGKIKSVGGKALDSLRSHFSKVGKSATSLMKPISKVGTALKNTFKRVFLMAGIYAAFRAIKDGLLEAAKADEQFSKSLNDVKANLAIAFQPILQAIMPALNTLMAGLATVTKAVAGFIAGLFGSTYKQAAEATKKLKTTADAAKKAKMSMAGIDEMNVLSSGDDSSSSDNGGTDYSNIDMSEPELPDWAEKLKESIKKGDWKGVGAILAERVNSAFSVINWDNISAKLNSGIGKVTDTINGFLDRFTKIGGWETLGDTVAGGLNTITSAVNKFYGSIDWGKLGGGIAKGLNQAINKTNWEQLGKSLSAGIKALIDTAFAFVSTFDFKGLGSGIGTAVNGWFSNIDFKKLGKTVSMGVKGALDTAISAVKTIDWKKIGESIYDALSNIDWGGIASRVFELLGSALGAAVSLLWGAIKNLIKSIGDFFTKEFEKMDTGNIGLDIILGILCGIGDAIIGIGKWIYDHVLKPFIDGFTQVLPTEIWDGIKSAFSAIVDWFGEKFREALDIVTAIWSVVTDFFSGIWEGIKSVFTGIGDWFKEKFETALAVVITVWSAVHDFFQGIWDGIKSIFAAVGDWFKEKFQEAIDNVIAVWIVVHEFFQGIWDGIKEIFSSIGTWFKEKFQEAWDNVKAIWSVVTAFFQKIWEGIKNVFSKIGSWFKDKFKQALDNVKAVWSVATNFFSGLWDGIKNVFSKVGTWFKDKFKEALDNIKAVFSGIGDFFSGIWDKIKNIFSNIGTKIGDAFSGAFKNVVNTIFEWIESKINGFLDMINGAIGLINKIPGVELGYLDHIELPRLAQGGLATAPTLAMVGDNRNAKTDPEVISPLSKLQGMVGADPEIVELLRMIVELLKSGMNIEIINYLFRNSKEFSREVLNVVKNDKARSGQ